MPSEQFTKMMDKIKQIWAEILEMISKLQEQVAANQDDTAQKIVKKLRPAFVNTLFPVTRPHHIYPTALVIIISNDNLKYIIIFVYVWFL